MKNKTFTKIILVLAFALLIMNLYVIHINNTAPIKQMPVQCKKLWWNESLKESHMIVFEPWIGLWDSITGKKSKLSKQDIMCKKMHDNVMAQYNKKKIANI